MGYVYDYLVSQQKLLDEKDYGFHQSLTSFWADIAGNIVVAPRRSGKTVDLIKYTTENLIQTGKVLVIVPYPTLKIPFKEAGYGNVISSADELNDYLRGRAINQTHLVVDEFMFIKFLREALANNWKSVTMVGSFIVPRE